MHEEAHASLQDIDRMQINSRELLNSVDGNLKEPHLETRGLPSSFVTQGSVPVCNEYRGRLGAPRIGAG